MEIACVWTLILLAQRVSNCYWGRVKIRGETVGGFSPLGTGVGV